MHEPNPKGPKDGDCFMATGVETGTNYRVTVYGATREEINRKCYGRAYALHSVTVYTMPPHNSKKDG